MLSSCEFGEIHLEEFDFLRKLVNDKWVVQETGTDNPIRDMFFLDSQLGWALAYETLIRTENGGNSWEKLALPVFVPGGSIHFSDASNGWIKTVDGIFLKSTDGGQSWSTVPLDSYIQQFYPLDAQTAWAITNDQTVLKTTDGWESWDTYEVPLIVGVVDLKFVSTQTGWAVGYGEFILKTMDGGLTWEDQSPNRRGDQAEINDYQAAFFLDEKTGWLIGATSGAQIKSYLLKTVDGGQTWDTQLLGVSSYPPLARDIYFLDSQTGYIVGNENERGILFSTTDGGQTWLKEEIFTDRELCCLYVSDEEEIWVAGDDGLILHRPGKQ